MRALGLLKGVVLVVVRSFEIRVYGSSLHVLALVASLDFAGVRDGNVCFFPPSLVNRAER